jgi:hypothetical protein
MEGHPTKAELGRSLAPGDDDSSIAARKHAFLLLDRERSSLSARRRAPWHLLGRYEDLYLVTMLTRLERDWLSQPKPRLPGGDFPSPAGDQFARGVAEWAKPWRLAPLMKLDTDVHRLEGALMRSRRWLSPLAVAEAERSARKRLEEITTQLEERNPWEDAVGAASIGSRDEKTRVCAGPPEMRIAATVGVLFVAAAGVGLLAASNNGSGPLQSVSGPGVPAGGASQRPAVLDVGARGDPVKGDRGAAHPYGRHARQPSAKRRPPATRHEAPPTVPVVSNAAPPVPRTALAPEQAGVPLSAPAPEPAPAPQPPDSPPRRTSSRPPAAGGGGGDCPPEFGYEC